MALQIAATKIEVVVQADVTPLVTTENATLANTLENKRLAQLPLNGRFLQNIITTTVPGLEGNSGTPRVRGLREGAFEFVQDGAVLSQRFNTGLSRPPGLDSIAEVRVETNISSAKNNRPSTAILSTKSGTNALHGAAFYTGRNNGFGVARRREDFYDEAPKLIRNEFGASLGGPVLLPKVHDGRNRSFFFLAWEDYRQRENVNRIAALATEDMRNGIYTGFANGAGQASTLYDPYSTGSREQQWQRSPFPNNRIPT